MSYNLSYDYASIVALLLLLFFYFYTPKFRNFQNILFGWILAISLVTTTFDALSARLIMSKYADVIWLNSMVICIFQIALHLLPALYYIYILLIVYGEKTVSMLKNKGWITLLPIAVVEFINIVSPLTHWGYIYDETGYHRTWFYFVTSAAMAFYMIACLLLAFIFKKRTGFLPKITVIVYTSMTLIFTYIQYLHPETLLLCAAVTISIFTMYMSLQSPALLKEALEEAESLKKVAEEANEAKSNFLANMSHEIRTPMNAIRGMTYLLEGSELKTDAREYVNTIQVASENLLILINEILDFSKVDSGKMVLSNVEYKTDELIREISGMILGQLDQERVAATLYVDPEIPKVLLGDVSKVRQIILNLLNNAIKFTDDGQILLHITAQKKDEGKIILTIKVRDTGIGIKDEDKGKLFEQFEQVDMAKNRRKEGTGLGLSLVKSYCELMNGHVEVESVFGSGSTFTAVVEQEIVEEAGCGYSDEIKNSVFVVLDKNPFVRRSIERALRSVNANFSVEEEFSKDAYEKFPGMKYYVIYNFKEYSKAVKNAGFDNVNEIALIDYNYKIQDAGDSVVFERNPFSVLTLMKAFSQNAEKEAKPKEEETAFNPDTKIAIVDDNKVNLKVTSAILKKFGITANTFLSGYEMLDEFDNGNQYDLIFMDHMMPDMDGVETVKRIRALRKLNSGKVPIVALTANAVAGVEQEFFAAGMDDALFKPVSASDLTNCLKKWLPGQQVSANAKEEKKTE